MTATIVWILIISQHRSMTPELVLMPSQIECKREAEKINESWTKWAHCVPLITEKK